MTKTRKQLKAIKRGTIALIIGLIIAIAYFCKWFPLNPVENIIILTVWSYTGLGIAALTILYGLCELFIEGDL